MRRHHACGTAPERVEATTSHRGPVGAAPDDARLAACRRVNRKAWAKLHVGAAGDQTSTVGHAHGPKAHDGTIPPSPTTC